LSKGGFLRILLLFYFFLLSGSSFGAVYGDDDRFLVEGSLPQVAVLAQLEEGRFLENEDGLTLFPITLIQKLPQLCNEEKFSTEYTLSKCTSFMVSENLMVTAGHCVNTQKECEKKRWIFSEQHKVFPGALIPHDQVIKCKKLVEHKKNRFSRNDYALIEIESTHVKFKPFEFSKENPFQSKEFVPKKFFVLGHPSGLPLIHSGIATQISFDSQFILRINSDTFAGNSGSPVIDADSGKVFGILTNGDTDYKMNQERGCVETHHCDEGECKGEDVVPLFNISTLVPGPKPQDPLFDPQRPRL
jgi:V8-like Glu-specific endopeptidase